MRFRLAILVSLSALILLLLPGAAFGWANGPDGPDSFGSHDWILQEGNRLAAQQDAAWVDLAVALPRTDDPDSVFHDFYYHVYDVSGDPYGDAPKKVMEYYGKALAARKAGKIAEASKWVGVMAHYYADICCPLHTDQIDAEDAMHSEYESDVDDYTDAAGENRDWVTYDGFTATKDVSGYAKSTAAAANKQYSALVEGYSAAGMSAAVVAITARSMNRAANGLADLIVSLKKGIKGSAAGGGGGGGGGDDPTVYITASGSKYHNAGCHYLSGGGAAIKLSQAKARGLEPCSVCGPPT